MAKIRKLIRIMVKKGFKSKKVKFFVIFFSEKFASKEKMSTFAIPIER